MSRAVWLDDRACHLPGLTAAKSCFSWSSASDLEGARPVLGSLRLVAVAVVAVSPRISGGLRCAGLRAGGDRAPNSELEHRWRSRTLAQTLGSVARGARAAPF